MSVFRYTALFTALIVMTGCIDATIDVKVKKDGSGVLMEKTYLNDAAVQMMAAMMAPGLPGAQGENTAPADQPTYDKNELRAKAAEYGEGVKFLGVKDHVNKQGRRGYIAKYIFPDITKLNLKPESGKGTPDAMGKIAFDFEPGETARLTIHCPPGPKKESDPSAKESEEEPAPEQVAQMQQMLDGMRFWLRVRVDGKISKTNAEYVNKKKNGITLIRMDVGKLVQDIDELKKVGTNQPDDLAAMKAALGHLKYMQIEGQEKIEVEFQ